MINYETILSSYDDKLTLMQWLKKVEAALMGAALASVEVIQPDSFTLTFKFVFADGSEVESEEIHFNEPITNAYVDNGHLHLVLRDGEDLDAGNLWNGDVSVSGILSVNDLNVANVATIETIQGNNANFDGDVDVAGAMNIGGAATIGDAVSMESTLSVTGKITCGDLEQGQPTITATWQYPEYYTLTPIFKDARIVEKFLIITAAATIIRTDAAAAANPAFLKLKIPSSLGQKIFVPNIFGSNYTLSLDNVNFATSIDNYVYKVILATKNSNTELTFSARHIHQLTLDTEYYFRYQLIIDLSNGI